MVKNEIQNEEKSIREKNINPSSSKDEIKMNPHQNVQDKFYKCSQCGKTSLWPGGLKRHIQMIHEESKQYFCPHCGKLYTNYRNLKSHITFAHVHQQPADKEIYENTSKVKDNIDNNDSMNNDMENDTTRIHVATDKDEKNLESHTKETSNEIITKHKKQTRRTTKHENT